MSSPLVHNRGNFNWIRRCVRAHSTRREKWWLRSKMVDTKSWLFFVCVLSTWALSFCANDFLVAQLNSTQWDNDSEKLSHKFNELPEWLRIFFFSLPWSLPTQYSHNSLKWKQTDIMLMSSIRNLPNYPTHHWIHLALSPIQMIRR